MSRDWRVYLDDIAQSCDKIRRFTRDLTAAQFRADDRTYDAVLRNLEVIGEAAKHVPQSVRDRMPDVAWRKVAGLRDMIAHAHFGIDDSIVWDIIETRVPELQDAIERFLDESDGTSSR
jgi:uncharacterized protein with HEPN domain